MAPNECKTLPNAIVFQEEVPSRLASDLCKHFLLRGADFDVEFVTCMTKRLKAHWKSTAVAHALKKCIETFISSNGMLYKLKGRILILIKLCPECCSENRINYSPLDHLLTQTSITPDKDILVAILTAAPSSPLKTYDSHGETLVTPLHGHLMGTDPDFFTVLTVLTHCPAAARYFLNLVP